MNVISVFDLTKDYGCGKGIFGLNFDVGKGEVFGYLGPNGAGKTVTIRHLLGFLNPDRGSCTINGLDCRTQGDVIHRSLGYLPGEIAFFDDMTGEEYLRFMAKLRDMKSFDKMHELKSYFELDTKGRIKKMSKGTKQKLGIITAFMYDPSILILDEPTSGLDPLMQNKFIDLILNEKKQGKTILMSSHSFEEVERTCDRVGIIKQGHFVAVKTVEELKHAQRKIYRVTLPTIEDADRFAAEPIDITARNQNRIDVAVSGSLKPLTTALDRHAVVGIDVVSQSLEEIFMSYYGGNNNDK